MIAMTSTRPTGRSATKPRLAEGSVADTANAYERILDAALEVIARRGYSAAGVQEIVDLSATSKGSFYFHFASKEQMVMALVERMSQKLIDKVYESVSHQPSPLHRVAGSIDTLIATFARKRKIAQVLLVNITGNGKDVDRKFLPVRERFSGLIQKELDAAVQAGQIKPIDTLLVSRMWVGGLQEVILHWLMTGQPSPLTAVTPSLRLILLQSIGADPAILDATGGVSGKP